MFTVKKFVGGEQYQLDDGKEYIHTGGRMYAVVNGQNQVMRAGTNLIHMYTRKYIAQYEAERMNSNV